MQKNGVRTLSIIDTLSELAQQTEEGRGGGGGLRHFSTPPGLVRRATLAEAANDVDNLTTTSIASVESAPYYHYPLNNPPPGDAPPPPSSIRQRRQAPPPPPPLPQTTVAPEPPSLQPRSPKVVNIVQPSPPKLRLRNQQAPPPSSVPLTVSPLNTMALEISSTTTSSADSPKKTPVIHGNGARGARQRRPFADGGGGGGGGASSSSRGHTPDWIRDIFLNAKRGIIEKLSASLEGLEPTLIRNLTDHHGNNLLHTVCYHGHVNLLPWVTRRFANELGGALSDENRRGFTPIVYAIKIGNEECVQWLVRNTSSGRDKLNSKEADRQRSLLHTASKYGQDDICNWLCDEMTRDEIDVSQVDMAGNTPLHLAAKEGRLSTLATLLHHGEKVHLKNDMGLKAFDCARLADNKDSAEYLLLFETSLAISSELLRARSQQEAVQNENAELRGHFKDVLLVAKKLSKERDEMCRELGRLYESMMELHNNMTMEIQVLTKENESLRRNSATNNAQATEPENSLVEACTALHERWQHHQRQWFNGSLADSEHKLIVTEEARRRSKAAAADAAAGQSASSSYGVSSGSMDHAYNHRHLRDRIEEIRAESGQLPTTALPSNTDSEHDEETDQDEAAENNVEAQEMRRLRQSIAQRKKLATPSPPNNVTNGAPGGRHRRTASSGSIEDGVYSTLSNEMYSKVASPGGSVHITAPMAQQTAEAALTANRPDKRRSREELKQRLRELALTSETGSASVIEVIEPTSSEEDEFRRSVWHEMNVKWAAGGAAAAAGPMALAEDHRGVATVPRRRKEAAAMSKRAVSVSAGGVELSPTKRLLEMGISPSTLEDLRTAEENDGGRQLPTPRARTMLHLPAATSADDAHDDDKKSSGFFKKIANWNKKRGERKEPAGREGNDQVDGGDPDADGMGTAEEHVLPDSFEDVAASPSEEGSKGTPKVDFILHSAATAKPGGTAGAIGSATEGSRSSSSSGNKSLSPQSRKSLNGSKSTMVSEDSGIFVSKTLSDMQGTASLILPNGLGKIEESSRSNRVTGLSNGGTEPGTGRVQRAVLRMNNNTHNHNNFDVNPVTLLRKKSLESKAWYDVPSDEERAGGGSGGVGEQEVDDEADESLASIISTGRPSSDED